MNHTSRVSRSSWGLGIFILLFIFSPVLSTQETAQPGALYVIALVVPIFFMALQKGLIRPIVINLYAVLLFVFALISTAFSDLGDFRVGAFMKYLLLIIFFISTSSVVFTPKQLIVFFKSYFGLSIALSILIILSFIFGYPHTSSDYYQGRYSIGITGLYKNPNYLASFYNLAFFVVCYILATVKLKKKKKFFLYLILVMFIISSYFTGTRAALLVELLVIISMPIVMAKKRHLYRIIPVVVIVSVVFIYYYDVIFNLISLFLGERDAFQDVGRTEAWNQAYKHIKGNPIFGCGHNSWYKIHGTGYLEWLHNIFLELLLDQGLIGILLFWGIVSTGFKKTNAKDRIFLIMLFLFSSIPMFLQNGLYEVHFWRYIIIIRLMMNFSTSCNGGINTFLNSAFGIESNHNVGLMDKERL